MKEIHHKILLIENGPSDYEWLHLMLSDETASTAFFPSDIQHQVISPSEFSALDQEQPLDFNALLSAISKRLQVRRTFEIKHVDDFLDGLAILAKESFSVVFLGESYTDNVQVLFNQQNKHFFEVPVIFFCNRENPDLAAQILSFGAQDYIVKKDTSSKELVRTIVHAIERFKSQSAFKQSIDETKQYAEALLMANASKDKFLSIISHDLRGPVSTIMSSLELLNLEVEQLEPNQIQRLSKGMYNSIQKVYHLLEDLLQWSKIHTEQIQYRPIQIAMHELVVFNIDIYFGKAVEKNIRILEDIDPNLIVYADKHMLNSIVQNLISNAIKFTSNGSIEIVARVHESNVVLQVTDSGMGMSQEVQERLFQIDKPYTSVGTAGETGTGLGLLLCKEQVERNHGTIAVASEPGKGTTFTITLPQHAPKTEEGNIGIGGHSPT